MLILDGVYTLEQNGPQFHRVGAPDAPTLERLLNRLVRRIVRRLTRDGFSLNAAVACQAHQRDRLECLCRYITRPALCLERLSTNAAGQIVYALNNPFRDGTTHVLFTPQDFIARLAALVPRPRVNLTRYHGVFAPSSPMRRAIVPTPARVRKRRMPKDSDTAPANQQLNPTEPPIERTDPLTAPLTWAQRLKRVFVRSHRDRHRQSPSARSAPGSFA
jgi:hypothetical protein